MSDEEVYIIEVFKGIGEKVSTAVTSKLQLIHPTITGVHFLVGHHTEIKARLQAKAGSTQHKFDRFPLIALFQDFVEKRGDGSGFYGEVTLQSMILYHTSKTDFTEDRYGKVFKPILYPIYHEYLKQIIRSRMFVIASANEIPHDKIDRPHWGNPAVYGNDGYLLNDVLDGIELRNMRLKISNKSIC